MGNDFGFREVFARQVEALLRPGDVVLLISTSGNSENVLEALARARRLGAVTIAMTGQSGGELGSLVDLALRVPSDETQRIQEVHLLIDHLLCQVVENLLGLSEEPAAPAWEELTAPRQPGRDARPRPMQSSG